VARCPRTFTWTRDRDVDTIHLAGCTHNRLSTEVAPLAAGSVVDAQREVAGSMGWDNWPETNDSEFDIHVAPCARS
jgi:hypothetical protein